jgi:peptidoglycan hydrolase-like protein with peptidoglycan-binding domain
MLVLLLASTAIVAGCSGDRGTTTSPTTAASQRPAAVAVAQPSADTRDAQQRLKDLGMYNGPVDGLWGPDTQYAVERYQRERGLATTGRIDEPTRMALRETASTRGTTGSMGAGAAGSAAVALSNPTDVRTVQNRLRQLNFYQGEANGMWGPDTQVAVENFQRARGLPIGQMDQATLRAMGLDSLAMSAGRDGSVAGIAPAAGPGAAARTLSPRSLSRANVRDVQRKLSDKGQYRAGVDGIWGPKSEDALIQFQTQEGLRADGQLTPQTVNALGLDMQQLSTGARMRQGGMRQ